MIEFFTFDHQMYTKYKH